MNKNHSKENKRIIKENVVLIQEINHLKQEQHKLTAKIQKLTGREPTHSSSLSSFGRPPRGSSRAKSARMVWGKQINRLKEEI